VLENVEVMSHQKYAGNNTSICTRKSLGCTTIIPATRCWPRGSSTMWYELLWYEFLKISRICERNEAKRPCDSSPSKTPLIYCWTSKKTICAHAYKNDALYALVVPTWGRIVDNKKRQHETGEKPSCLGYLGWKSAWRLRGKKIHTYIINWPRLQNR
jgi:hypothetical protein